eukprot:Selendium_serpulae@DN5924_c0_g1_i1.p1
MDLITSFECKTLKAMTAQVLFAFYPNESDMIMFRMTAIQEGPDMQGDLIKWLLSKREEQLDREAEESSGLRAFTEKLMGRGGSPVKRKRSFAAVGQSPRTPVKPSDAQSSRASTRPSVGSTVAGDSGGRPTQRQRFVPKSRLSRSASPMGVVSPGLSTGTGTPASERKRQRGGAADTPGLPYGGEMVVED